MSVYNEKHILYAKIPLALYGLFYMVHESMSLIYQKELKITMIQMKLAAMVFSIIKTMNHLNYIISLNFRI